MDRREPLEPTEADERHGTPRGRVEQWTALRAWAPLPEVAAPSAWPHS
jgi:hypothetical protein